MTPKALDQLSVYRNSMLAGTLHRTPTGWEFKFTEDFLKNQEFHELAYTIPKRKEPYRQEGVNLPPFFAGLLPEGLRLRLLVKNLKTSHDDLFSLLAASGHQTVGDVYVLSNKLQRPSFDPVRLEDTDLYEFFYQSAEASVFAESDASIAGVQEKISASMMSLPIKTTDPVGSYIIKLNPKDKDNLIQNELQCLKLAKKCGIKTNTAKLIHDKNKNPALLIERFDRVFNSDSPEKPIMIHQEDACQFLNKYPADKYRMSLREVAERVAELSTAPQIDILKLIQLYAFSYLIGNGDLHAKNISLQTDPRTKRTHLTPAYDLIGTYIYQDYHMALPLDGQDDNIKRSHIVAFSRRLNIAEKAIHQMLDRLLKKFTQNKSLLFQMPLSDKQKNSLRTMMEKRIRHLSY